MVVGKQPLEIRVHDLHVDLRLNGKILMHSEDYSSVGHANRAALTLRDAMINRPLRVRIMHWAGKVWRLHEWTHYGERT